MITCPKCSKDNQDHYKFCLGCGAELPRDASPRKFAPGTPPHGVAAMRTGQVIEEETAIGGVGVVADPALAAPPAPATTSARPPAPVPVPSRPPPAPAPAPAPAAPALGVAAGGDGPALVCPQCDHSNTANNKFCASCGFKLARPAAAPPAAPAPAAGPVAGSLFLTALRADGTEAGSYTLPGGSGLIGRDTGGVFAGDSYLSPRHATFSLRSGKLFIRDEGSLNGVYRKLYKDDPVPIEAGDVFRIGQELVRFEALAPGAPTADGVERLGSPSKGYVGRIATIIGRDTTGNAFPVPEAGLHLGRERGDVLFPEDGYVSGLHCQLTHKDGKLALVDLGSSNGTFVRINQETEVQNGDILLMGQQLFRLAF